MKEFNFLLQTGIRYIQMRKSKCGPRILQRPLISAGRLARYTSYDFHLTPT